MLKASFQKPIHLAFFGLRIPKMAVVMYDIQKGQHMFKKYADINIGYFLPLHRQNKVSLFGSHTGRNQFHDVYSDFYNFIFYMHLFKKCRLKSIALTGFSYYIFERVQLYISWSFFACASLQYLWPRSPRTFAAFRPKSQVYREFSFKKTTIATSRANRQTDLFVN